jgi:hypothetical protein
MNLRANAMTQLGTALKKLADAAGPLYKSLDEAQKQRFVMLAHLSGGEFGKERGAHGHRGHGGWWHHGSRGSEGGPRPL